MGYLHWRESQKSQDNTRNSAPRQTPTPASGSRTKTPAAPDKKPSVSTPPTPTPAPAPGPVSTPPDFPVSDDRIKPTRSADQPKAVSDLKTGSLKLEKATGSSLVYAVGSLTNDSSHQRYGVRVEVALTDGTGKAAGIARDYRPVLEPGEIWRFRALILDSRAKGATLKEVLEDP